MPKIPSEVIYQWILEQVETYAGEASYVHLWRDITKLHADQGGMALSIQRITGACTRLVKEGKLFKSARRGYVYGLKEKMRRDARPPSPLLSYTTDARGDEAIGKTCRYCNQPIKHGEEALVSVSKYSTHEDRVYSHGGCALKSLPIMGAETHNGQVRIRICVNQEALM